MELFFHGIKGNILFRCAVNELHEAMSFSLAQEIEPIRNIAVRLEHAVHIRKLYQDPIPFHRPSVLILYEPTNGLDPAGIREIRDYLRKLAREERLAVVVSSHLLSEMEMMCDRFVIIQHGKLVTIESVQELSQQTEKVLFIVEPKEKAAQMVKAHDPHLDVRLVEQGLEVTLDYKDIPWLNAMLVAEGINVYGIHVLAKSLEEIFLEMTGGNEIA